MTLQSNTSFNHHIDGTVTKAKQTFLRRNLKICSTKTNDRAYKSLVRLVLEYTSMLAQSGTPPPRRTSPGLKRYSYRQVMWFVLSTSSVDKMLQHFYWPTLTQCCKLACLSVMYKVTNQLTLSSHLSLNCEGCWGSTGDFTTSFLHFSLLSTAIWDLACSRPVVLGELKACPFPGVVFQPLPLSALSSSQFHCALQDGFGQT